jgi:hypothetical protein
LYLILEIWILFHTKEEISCFVFHTIVGSHTRSYLLWLLFSTCRFETWFQYNLVFALGTHDRDWNALKFAFLDNLVISRCKSSYADMHILDFVYTIVLELPTVSTIFTGYINKRTPTGHPSSQFNLLWSMIHHFEGSDQSSCQCFFRIMFWPLIMRRKWLAYRSHNLFP